MHADLAMRMMGDLFWTGLLVCLPILGITMLVGLAISVLQVVTQVQEMSLTFVPKLIVVALSIMIFGSLILGLLSDFTIGIFERIPDLVK